MNWLKQQFNLPQWAHALMLLAIMILAFGLLTPSLGFYFDDWVNLYVLKSGGNLWEYLRYDRPFSAWTFIVTYPILGPNPLNWQIFTLIIRWLSVVAMWWTLRQIWPERPRQVLWMALIFGVHPIFSQQAIALTYSQNFMTYALFFASLGSMLFAIRNPKWFWPFTVLALLTEILHIFTMEYFWGLELLRPVLIWLALKLGKITLPQIKRTLKLWLPYLTILILAILWRQSIYSLALGGPATETDLSWNELNWFGLLLASPGQALLTLSENVLGDFVFVMLSSWYETLQPSLFDFQSRFGIITWGLVIGSAAAIYIYFQKAAPAQDEETANQDGWARQALFLGTLIFLFGTLPIWMINKNITLGMFSDRFALPAMFGAAIFLIALITYFGIGRQHQLIILAVLVGLAVGGHFRTANQYRWAWTKQQRFFWQLYWRAPQIEPNTAIFSSGSLFSYTGDYPTAFAINTLYDRAAGSTQLPYWFFELDRGFHQDPRPYLRGITVADELRNYSFSGNSLDALVIHFDYENGSCLWILDESGANQPNLPPLTQLALPMSSLERIQPDGALPSQTVFGPEPEKTWCYYFQKAEQARQQFDWGRVIKLAQEAEEAGQSPNNKIEWLPFIEAYAQKGKLEKAKDLTLAGYESNPGMAAPYCQQWAQFLAADLIQKSDEALIDAVYDTLKCGFYLSESQ